MFSSACEYALRAMVYIESDGTDLKKRSLQETVQTTHSPVAFTHDKVQQLQPNGPLVSYTGTMGSFQRVSGTKVNIHAIITAIFCDEFYNRFVMDLKTGTSQNPCLPFCPSHAQKEMIIRELLQCDIRSVAEGVRNHSIKIKGKKLMM